jgi:hypothetical protein
MPVSNLLIPGYQLRAGSTLERALLLKFLQRTYKEVYPKQDFAHLAITVDQYLSHETPIWWVEVAEPDREQDPPPVHASCSTWGDPKTARAPLKKGRPEE